MVGQSGRVDGSEGCFRINASRVRAFKDLSGFCLPTLPLFHEHTLIRMPPLADF